MLSPQEKRDKLTRATDLDALACRYCANQQSYIVPADPFITPLISSYRANLQFCSGYSNLSAGRTLRSVFGEKKLPLINRGTYLRTKSIDQVAEQFVKEFEKCQIISLGGGSDTRGFNLINNNTNITYHEIDFPESVKMKKIAISNDNQLRRIIGYDDENIQIGNREQFQSLESDIHTERYHLYGYDLRNLNKERTKGESALTLHYIDPKLPTLLLSECVLCYLSPEDNESIIKFWKGVCLNLLSILIYEPMSLNDVFGSTMTKNLSERGINLHTFNEYPNLNSRNEFLSKVCGLSNIRLTDMSNVGGYAKSSQIKPWIDDSELKRINRLEMIDEIEELKLLFEHYCLCYGECNAINERHGFEGINSWSWQFQS